MRIFSLLLRAGVLTQFFAPCLESKFQVRFLDSSDIPVSVSGRSEVTFLCLVKKENLKPKFFKLWRDGLVLINTRSRKQLPQINNNNKTLKV